MPKKRSNFEKVAGKLVSAIQRVWSEQDVGNSSEFSLDVLDAAHNILLAKDPQGAREVLKGQAVISYLGDLWVRRHPAVQELVDLVQLAIDDN